MMTKKRQLHSLILLVALTWTAFAQQPNASAPSVDRIRHVITYLASDALEGRRTGTPGATEAAHYIAGEFSLIGLRPGMQPAMAGTRGGNQSAYLQPFPYVSKVELGRNNLFFANPGRADDTEQFLVGEDWMPFGFSTNGSIKNSEVVFAGYGISSAELKYDDYAVSSVKDRVAVVFAGTPDGDNPHGQFAQAGQIRFKVAAARAAGARALLIVSDEDKLKDDRLSRLSYDNSGEAGIPVIAVSRQLGAKLLNMENTAVLTRAQSVMSAWVLGGGPTASCKTPCGVTHNFPIAVDIPPATSASIWEIYPAAFAAQKAGDPAAPLRKRRSGYVAECRRAVCRPPH